MVEDRRDCGVSDDTMEPRRQLLDYLLDFFFFNKREIFTLNLLKLNVLQVLVLVAECSSNLPHLKWTVSACSILLHKCRYPLESVKFSYLPIIMHKVNYLEQERQTMAHEPNPATSICLPIVYGCF